MGSKWERMLYKLVNLADEIRHRVDNRIVSQLVHHVYKRAELELYYRVSGRVTKQVSDQIYTQIRERVKNLDEQ